MLESKFGNDPNTFWVFIVKDMKKMELVSLKWKLA